MKQVTIWFDKNFNLHSEKVCCGNSFALAKFKKDDENVLFKASAVIDGNKLLFQHNQVTYAGACFIGYGYSSSATIRKHFFNRYMRTIEAKIKEYVRGKKYTGTVELRFRIGVSTYDMFASLGYKMVANSTEKSGGYCYNKYILVYKSIA